MHRLAGLMAVVLERDEQGALIRKAGVMAVVVAGGPVMLAADVIAGAPDRPRRRVVRRSQGPALQPAIPQVGH